MNTVNPNAVRQYKNIAGAFVGLAPMALSTGAGAFSTYNVVFITNLDASPNPFNPDRETSSVSVRTFEYAEWYWLVSSTMVQPTVIVTVAGRPLIANVTASYQADAFGGVDTLRASAFFQPDLFNTQRLTVRVPNLQLLPNSADYVKIGGTPGHLGPPLSVTDNNHYGTATLIAGIQAISAEHRWTFTQLLQINDMSLPQGGGFDIRGGWRLNTDAPACQTAGGGHCTHRFGTNVDVSDLTADGFLVNSFWLEPAVTDHNGLFRDEGNHFHLTFQ